MPDPRTNRPQHRRRSLFNLTGCASRTKTVVSLVNKAKAPYRPSAKKKTLHAELDLANCGELTPRRCSTLTKYALFVEARGRVHAKKLCHNCDTKPAFAAETDFFDRSHLLILRKLLKTQMCSKIPAYRFTR
jgi:hypothetical protein